MAIPVIDIFAGPGGLGEGFSSLNDGNAFDIKLSIEMEENAHKTLLLRAFVRQFKKSRIPEEYYDVMRAADLNDREIKKELLFQRYPSQYKAAVSEAWQCTLGDKNFPPEMVNARIQSALEGAKDWVLIGGPPCQAYSLAGRSRRQETEELNPNDHRVDLYKEYLRIIADNHPSVFVMENVKGLLSSRVNGRDIFPRILRDLSEPANVFKSRNAPNYKIYSLVKSPAGYDISGQPLYHENSDYLIRAEEHGIPQKRHRVILLGIRSDIQAQPGILNNSDVVTLQDVISDLPKIRSGLARKFVKSEVMQKDDGTLKTKRHYEKVKDSDTNWRRIINKYRKEIESLNGFTGEESKAFTTNYGVGSEFIAYKAAKSKRALSEWYYDPNIGGVANHQSRSHLVQDLKRYLFACMYCELYGRFPRMKDYAEHDADLLPDHQSAETGKFNDRFRVQIANEPATTVTSHISKDGHYFIHYDSAQCRSLTVREAARVQTFPDNYLFCGARTAQYHQVGNAVPPYLAYQVAYIVKDIF